MIKGNLIIGQSGGPTRVINQSLVGIIEEALKHEAIEGIFGAHFGLKGILKEDFIDLRKFNKETLELVAQTPGAALGSCRHKPTEEDCEKVFDVFHKHNVKYWFYIGGNDSAETADIVNNIARQRNYELRIFHIPKTIDNDLVLTDHCPGYPSAAKYIALVFQGDDLDNRSLPGVKINIVMGRHAGWLTAAAALGGAHLCYFPERPVSMTKIVKDIDEVYKKEGRCLVAVSEGVRNSDGKLMLESKIKEFDAHGNPQLSGSGDLGDFFTNYVKEHSYHQKLRVRADTLGYSQRSFPGVVSEIDAKEARMVGQAAVKYAMKGDIDGSIILNRIGEGENYSIEVKLAKLADLAKKTKSLPDEFINQNGNGVTDKFIEYITPLVGELPLTKSLCL